MHMPYRTVLLAVAALAACGPLPAADGGFDSGFDAGVDAGEAFDDDAGSCPMPQVPTAFPDQSCSGGCSINVVIDDVATVSALASNKTHVALVEEAPGDAGMLVRRLLKLAHGATCASSLQGCGEEVATSSGNITGLAMTDDELCWSEGSQRRCQLNGQPARNVTHDAGTPLVGAITGEAENATDRFWLEKGAGGWTLRKQPHGGVAVEVSKGAGDPGLLAERGGRLFFSVYRAAQGQPSKVALMTVRTNGKDLRTVDERDGFGTGDVQADASGVYWEVRSDSFFPVVDLLRADACSGKVAVVVQRRTISRFVLAPGYLYLGDFALGHGPNPKRGPWLRTVVRPAL
jgi:hypothetical protein